MASSRPVGAAFRKGGDRRKAGRAAAPADPSESPGSEVDVDKLIAERAAADDAVPAPDLAAGISDAGTETASALPAAHEDEGPEPVPAPTPPPRPRRTRSQSPARPAAPGKRSVRSMFVPVQAAKGARVLAAMQEKDLAEIVMDAAREAAGQVAPAEQRVERRRRMHNERLQLHLSDEETAELDALAEARNMTRSTYLSSAMTAHLAAHGLPTAED